MASSPTPRQPETSRPAEPPIQVLVVDDSAVIRRLVCAALEADPAVTVIGTANNGRQAVEKLATLRPDLVTLDIEMPEMDGLEALVEIRRRLPYLPVIMCSTLTERAAAATLDALARGASDYVTKPTKVRSPAEAVASFRAELLPKVHALGRRRPLFRTTRPARPGPSGTAAGPTRSVPPVVDGRRPGVAPIPAARTRPGSRVTGRPQDGSARTAGAVAAAGAPADMVPPGTSALRRGGIDALVIGTSTGGPDALGVVLPALPADLPVPVLIVQHMPPVFTTLFAQRLNLAVPLRVREAEDGDPVRAGEILIAPGGHHLRVVRRPGGVQAVIDDRPPVNFCRPAVNVLFESVAEVFGSRVLAVVLTGMGCDGLQGCVRIRAVGGQVLVQDAETSVVWGMPGSVAKAGQADVALPLTEIGSAILAAICGGARSDRALGGSAPSLTGAPR
jgi:two-component system chemotaxis response regulator CheB